ncbi:GH25 family lysozyme [Dactylosporangium sucinum]|nr:GH25 family lysozyme [Dactylosporangium sucinum]
MRSFPAAQRRVATAWRLARRFVADLTPGQRKAALIATIVVSSPIWAVAAAPARQAPLLRLGPPVLEAVSAIEAARPAGFPVGGIDLSSHDHRTFGVHWPTEVAAGSRFVYIKATEGRSYVNPHFAADYATARATGRYVGAYVYARPDLGDPVGQAEHFLRHARFTRDQRTLVPFVDLEWPYAGVRADDCYNLSPERLRAWIAAFIGRIEAGIGRKPMIYTNTNWWNPCTDNDASYATYPLNIAGYTKRPPKLPAGWTTFAIWQYQPGDPNRRHSHDRDVVQGGEAGLRALAWPPPSGG